MGNLFQHQQIAQMNERELMVYNYVSSHLEEASKMNIRELAAACEVSTTTVLRFCGKLECDGYTEFKYRLQQVLKKKWEAVAYDSSSIQAIQYLQNLAGDKEIQKKIEQAARWCAQAKQILFLGEGVSGTIGAYGARLFSSTGVLAFSITDPYYPPPGKDMEDTVVFALSISGEDAHMISLLNSYKKRRVKLISITNTDQWLNRQYVRFAQYFPHVYFDTSNTIEYYGIENMTGILGAERFLFGTNMPEKEPYDKLFQVLCCELAQEQKELIAHGNFERLVETRA